MSRLQIALSLALITALISACSSTGGFTRGDLRTVVLAAATFEGAQTDDARLEALTMLLGSLGPESLVDAELTETGRALATWYVGRNPDKLADFDRIALVASLMLGFVTHPDEPVDDPGPIEG